MKLSRKFITYTSGTENIIAATGSADFSGVVRGNEIAGEVFTMLKKPTSRGQIVAALRKKYDAPAGKIEGDVDRLLAELKKIGALVE